MAEKEAKDLGFSFKNVGEALEKFKNPVQALSKEVTDSINTFNKLSSTGNSFSNDIIGMKVAAANTRMTLDELGAVVTKSGKDFSGLGGSVAKGGQVFTEFSKTFFDSGLTENLRQMGYSSKDLNEVLALQIGFQKSSTDTSVEGQIKTAKAAADLASEMDMVAKLTGVSRKEQEAALEKSKVDGQIEAKMRLIGLTQGADAEKAARENFAKQLTSAQAMGTDTIFKEMFATGTVRSREASIQMGIMGEAARETANSAKALSKGNVAASESAMKQAEIGNMNNQKNAAYLQIAAAGVGDVGKAAIKNVEVNDTQYQGLVKTSKALEAMGKGVVDTAEAMKAQREAIRDEQKARAGITSVIIAGQARLQDASAAITNKVIKPLNEGELAKQAARGAAQISQGVTPETTATQRAGQYAQALRNQGQLGGPSEAPVGSRQRIEYGLEKAGVPKIVSGIDKVTGGTAEALGEGFVKVKDFVADVINVKEFNAKVPSRDAGTLGKTGQPFEPNDILAKIHKGEMVLTPEQARNLVTGAKTEGLTTAVNDIAKVMPKIDITGLSRNTQVSTSSTPRTAQAQSAASGFEMPSMDQISFGPDGMPRISARPQARAMAEEVSATQANQNTPPPPSADNEAAKQGIMANQPASNAQPAAAAGSKPATLDDVVKGLESLNTTMKQLATMTNETNSLVERQVRATKSIGGNVYDRMA